ncbi:hypothetical protein FRC09_008781 [Ceratobasidium sp. 395]|nr:hypothetical protein FRC09_008781 [Ceratobasidium sp. 395]
MSQYRYEAASTSQSSSAPRTYSTSAPSISTVAEQNSAYTTRDRWTAVQSSPVQGSDEIQSPTVQIMGGERSPRSVRFQEASMQPHRSQHRADSPVSQGSAPSLVHSAGEHGDNLECPPTPEQKPTELAPKRSCLKPRTPAHNAALSTIEQIAFEVDDNVVAFEHPRKLDFETPEPASDINAVPRLTYTVQNKPLFEHIHKLESLQSELDGIPSYGDSMIRKARKAAGSRIQQELDGLARIRVRLWWQKNRSRCPYILYDENRKEFLPTPYIGYYKDRDVQQVWFLGGAHSDVGGGYCKHLITDLTLYWMSAEIMFVLLIREKQCIDDDFVYNRFTLLNSLDVPPELRLHYERHNILTVDLMKTSINAPCHDKEVALSNASLEFQYN